MISIRMHDIYNSNLAKLNVKWKETVTVYLSLFNVFIYLFKK